MPLLADVVALVLVIIDVVPVLTVADIMDCAEVNTEVVEDEDTTEDDEEGIVKIPPLEPATAKRDGFDVFTPGGG